VRLQSDRGVGWGEIAPLPRFGSETLAEAIALCRELGKSTSDRAIEAIPDRYPACQFAFASARAEIGADLAVPALRYSYLLPAGRAAIAAWKPAWETGTRTFKWKIGTLKLAEELAIFAELIRNLPAGARLRLDANGSLHVSDAIAWLEAADRAGTVEFIEQPLPVASWEQMQQLGARFETAIALDESVATVAQLAESCERGWHGLFAVKAAIAGSPERLRQTCIKYGIEPVFSSVFETDIGRRAALRLAGELGGDRAVGFGVAQWFEAADEFEGCLWNDL